MARILATIAVLIALQSPGKARDKLDVPPPAQDPKSVIVTGVLMIVNGFLVQEADRRNQNCVTYITGLNPDGFPLFHKACKVPEN